MQVQKTFNLWFTGLPSSGKSTTAEAVYKNLNNEGIRSIILDGDVLRKGLNQDLGFSKEDREENNRRTIYVSELIVKSGVPVLTAFISPYKSIRDKAREVIPGFIEVFISTPLEECMNRDVKGLYAKAKAGEIKNMTGLGSKYEEPVNPEIVIDTIQNTIEENTARIIDYLVDNDYLSI